MSFQQFTLQLGAQIQATRLERGLLQEDAAAELGISRVAIGYIEQGRRSPKLSTLFDLANLYDVDVRAFFSFLDDAVSGARPRPNGRDLFETSRHSSRNLVNTGSQHEDAERRAVAGTAKV